MKIAGIGFRKTATIASLRGALEAAGAGKPDALATVAEKAASLALLALAQELNVKIIAISADALKGIATSTQSECSLSLFGTGSVAEAAALQAAGPGARLVGQRAISPDRKATAAIAEVLE